MLPILVIAKRKEDGRKPALFSLFYINIPDTYLAHLDSRMVIAFFFAFGFFYISIFVIYFCDSSFNFLSLFVI